MANNPNDALLHRMQQMNLGNGSPNYQQFTSPPINRHASQPSTYQQQPIYQYMPHDAAGGIYENVEYTAGSGRVQVTDLDAIDTQKFESNNAKAQPQLKSSGVKANYSHEVENLRYAHTPQPTDVEPSPIYENLQVVSG
jgi:hypothetical protein